MFGSKRRKAADHVTRALQPFIGILSISTGVPPHFWQDDFVLGYFFMTAAFHLKETSGVKLGPEDRGWVLMEVFSRLSNMNGIAIVQDAMRRAEARPPHPDYELGTSYAQIVCLASLGQMTEEGRPHVEAARELSAALGHGHSVAGVGAALMHTLYTETIKKRFAH